MDKIILNPAKTELQIISSGASVRLLFQKAAGI